MDDPDEIVRILRLRPLPVEGGRWAQTWRDEHCTAIYYLLVAPEFSALHRLRHAEVFTYHAGAPVRMLLLHQDGHVSRPELGTDLGAGQRPQVVVPPGVWQGGRTLGSWSLLGTVVAPPYTDDIVDFGDDADLAGRYPEHAEEIRALCRAG